MYSGILDGYTQMAAAYDEVFQLIYDEGIGQLLADEEEDIAAGYKQELQQMYKEAAQSILSTVNSEMTNIREEMSDTLSEINSAMNDYANGVTSVYDADSEFNNGVIKLNDEINSSIDNIVKVKLNNVLDFVKSEDNARIEGAKNDIMMYRSGGLFAGVIVLMLFAYVMSVFVLNQINEECGIIGALYAMGVKKKALMLQYISLPVLIAFAGGCIGLVCGFSHLGVGILLSDSFSYYSVPDFPYVHSVYLIIYGCIMPPFIAFVVNYIMINKKLSQTALSLMRNEQKTGRVKNLKFRIKKFIPNYQVRQAIREIRTALAVVAGMFIALVILMLGLNEYAVCHNQKNETISQTKYQYMYSLNTSLKMFLMVQHLI